MEYKDTLLMPKTDFQMRGNLAENEKITRQKWEEMDLYNKILDKNKEGKPFILHDGPPYANGNIHIGHSLNKVLKDFVNRSKMMQGFYTPFTPGWDTHGLPIESALTNNGVDRKNMSKADFRKLCEEYAYEQVDKQREQFKHLNVIADWENPYITLTKKFEEKQIEVFAKMAQEGIIYKGLKPVYWSPSSETALAEAEIEYKEHKSPSVYVAFSVNKGNDKVKTEDNLVIWTTTPWTLPGNLGIAIGEKFEYVRVKANDKVYILAKELSSKLLEEFGFEDFEVLETLTSKDFDGVTYTHPLNNSELPVVIGFHVTLEAGTGLVHIAPGYGADDFIIGREFNLGLINGVNDQGYLTEESGKEFAGLFYEDANKEIGLALDKMGRLLKLRFIKHSYPHDWRTKKPVIFRATPQWFASIDPIREKILNEIDNVIDFHQEWGKNRLRNMIKDRGDWCISRQRAWGVPIPIFYNEDGSEILDYDVMMHVSKLFGEFGSNVWFEREAKDLLPEGYTNPLSPSGNFTKETDIMDVWFDSGSTYASVLENYPADLYLEGSDQYRGWFNSSIITGVATRGKAPYKGLVSHGFVLDSKGNKMSKSVGNVIDPLKIINKEGSDILRLWVSSVDYNQDVKIGDDLLKQVKESYRKIRNTYKFLLGNLSDFTNRDKVDFKDLGTVDQYVMVKLNEYTKEVINAYNNYDYQGIYKLTTNFIANTLSTFYLDFTKDVLYTYKADSIERRSVQTVLNEVINNFVKLLAPILPYTSEEAYLMLNPEETSVHLRNFPEVNNYEFDQMDVMEKFFMLRSDVFKALEEARNEKVIGKGLEAAVKVNLPVEFDCLKQLNLKQLLIVSDLEIVDEDLTKYEFISVSVSKFNGHKCERCWNYFKEEEMVGEICNRCNDTIN